ncbi:MAG: hypothetical protein AABZ64_03565 [Nitrospinota bacterium]
MNAPEMVGLGSTAPAVRLQDGRGAPVELSALWGKGPLALVFMRHLG